MILFLDFDGVIVDSIEECYIVSKEAYYGHAIFTYDEDEYRKLFYQYRGLVRPAHEYRALHRAIEFCIRDEAYDRVEDVFNGLVSGAQKKEEILFEKEFFYIRRLHKELDREAWMNMNPLTSYGESLVSIDSNIFIVTTKNISATEDLLLHYNIPVSGIYANDDIKRAGSKGNLIKQVMDEKNEQSAIFIDDAVEHLNSVSDRRVKCYFADWGYGNNSNYPVYEWK